MSETLHGDLDARVAVDTHAMAWSPSPSGSVWRRRVYRVGPAESGRVTSVVRYEPGATFPAHDHPEGEEILVLEGVFSDEHGDWPAGTYLFNPEGFRHEPFSQEGCVLFVKLRQGPGRDRKQIRVDTTAAPWIAGSEGGVSGKPLWSQAGFPDVASLERWDAGAELPGRSYPGGAELFVLEGAFTDEHGSYGAGTWLRLPKRAQHSARSQNGCTLYIKRNALTLPAN